MKYIEENLMMSRCDVMRHMSHKWVKGCEISFLGHESIFTAQFVSGSFRL